MKYTFVFISLLVFTLSSCDLGGVKTNTNENDGIVENDTTSNNNTMNNISDTETDSTISDKPYALLKDTVMGQPNEMVYQREDGLRVEWTVKKDDPILLNEVVLVNYKARVAGGEQYDSNEEMGTPVPLKSNIGMLVEGWEDGLLQMNIGDIGRIMIPNALGYGENGYLTIVPPGADLIVEIEVIERVKPIELEEGVKVYKWKENKFGTDPVKNQLVTFDYFAFTTGEEGYMYDNSYKDRQPFSFKLENDNVIDGLHQGMSVLRSDERAFIEIPSALAYGNKGLVDLVPKNTDVVYDVSVISID